jgi:hypothetical protein
VDAANPPRNSGASTSAFRSPEHGRSERTILDQITTATFDRLSNMQQPPTPSSGLPQAEPEIYPPGSAIPHERIWASTGTHRTQRIYVAKLGPVGLTLLALLIGIVAVVATFVLIGVAVISVAMVAALAIGAILTTVLRGRFRRLR